MFKVKSNPFSIARLLKDWGVREDYADLINFSMDASFDNNWSYDSYFQSKSNSGSFFQTMNNLVAELEQSFPKLRSFLLISMSNGGSPAHWSFSKLGFDQDMKEFTIELDSFILLSKEAADRFRLHKSVANTIS